MKSGGSCSIKWGFPGFFSDKKKLNQTGLVITFLMEKQFLREIRLILLYEMGFSRNFFLTKTKLNQNDWFIMDLRSNEILMELGWIYTRIFFGKKTKLKQLEILHRARS